MASPRILFHLFFFLGFLKFCSSNQNVTTMASFPKSHQGGSSISGMLVTCHTSLENCLEACYMSCYITDLCNDQPDLAACAPGLTQNWPYGTHTNYPRRAKQIALAFSLICYFYKRNPDKYTSTQY